MLQAIRRWFSSGSPAGWTAAEEWAQSRHHAFKRSRDADGFVIDAGTPQTGWRMEWGPSQRPYIAGRELRLRGEIDDVDLQMMVLSRSLMDAMEKAVFEQFTVDLQTRIDTSTPEEMRWLVLFPKLPASELRMLRDSFGAASPTPQWLAQWLNGPLSQHLQQARSGWLAPEDPFALVLQRGRLTLRLAMPQPDAGRLTAASALFEVALREARRVALVTVDSSGAPSTQPSMWAAGDQ